MTTEVASPPAHLTVHRQALWRTIVADYDLEDWHLELLQLALEALDRCQEARETLAREGSYTTDRYGGRRAHPALAVERDSRIAAARLLRELGLEGQSVAR